MDIITPLSEDIAAIDRALIEVITQGIPPLQNSVSFIEGEIINFWSPRSRFAAEWIRIKTINYHLQNDLKSCKENMFKMAKEAVMK